MSDTALPAGVDDAKTAAAFATSWNSVGDGSVYTREQFLDWFSPLDLKVFAGKSVLELGFGNGSLLYHMGSVGPARLFGVELGDTLEQARRNLRHLPDGMLHLQQGDLTQVDVGRFDLVYCIGVLHHLADPESGFASVVKHTKPGGHFHCWVYGREGNGLIVHGLDRVRRTACHLPWWFTKYAIALPLVAPFFAYARTLDRLTRLDDALLRAAKRLPLGEYSLWIAQRPFHFFHHVAFDQLVTPTTHYFARSTIERWLDRAEVDPSSVYIVQRNGNSWKFGGRRAASS